MKKSLLLIVAMATGLLITWQGLLGEPAKPQADSPPARCNNITGAQAWAMVKKDPKHTFIVDVRTRPEYQFIGHPQGAYNIPYLFWTSEVKGNGYMYKKNPNFTADIRARFDPQTDTLLLICRSGGRSLAACKVIAETGWPTDRVYNITGGFEGDRINNADGICICQRKLNGWRTEGLPWDYALEADKLYQPTKPQ